MALPSGLLPAFASELVESGEALCYLHLSGNHAAIEGESLDARVGGVHRYETKVGDSTVDYSYAVLAVFRDSLGDLGQAVVYRPHHAHSRVVVAFRAMRPGKTGAQSADVASMLAIKLVRTAWLPRGAKMSIGVCAHASSACAPHVNGGLLHFLSVDCKGLAVHFTGLSLAGALAQTIALRAAREHAADGDVGSRAHVLTFGATPWGNAATADTYRTALGGRSVHLVTRLTQERPAHLAAFHALPVMPWWEPLEAGASPARFASLDPLTVGFAAEHAIMPHTYAISSFGDSAVLARANVHDAELDDWSSGADLRPVTAWPAQLVPKQRLHSLMCHELPEHDGLLLDYMRLHRGRAYKAALKALTRCAMDAQRGGTGDAGAPSLPTANTNAAAPTAVPVPPLAASVHTPHAHCPDRAHWIVAGPVEVQ